MEDVYDFIYFEDKGFQKKRNAFNSLSPSQLLNQHLALNGL